MKSVSPQTPYGDTIFCDDIREEVNGKLSLMGIYRGKLIVYSPLPVRLPKFAMLVTYSERPGESSSPVELRITVPGGDQDKPLFSAALPVEKWRNTEIDPVFSEEQARISIVSNVTFPGLELKQEGFIRVRAYRDDLEIQLGSLYVAYKPRPETADPVS